MPALSIQIPYPIFSDRDGQPLENGYVWIGQPYLDPQTSPVQVYLDEALSIPAAQPLRTLGGYVSNAGTPAQLYIDGVNFSIRVQDSKGTQVYYFPDGSGISPNAIGVTYSPGPDSLLLPNVPISVNEALDYISDDVDGSAYVGFQQTNSSVKRTTQDKLLENTSVLDFGADPTGTTDSQLNIVASFVNEQVYVPKGQYLANTRLDTTSNLAISGDGADLSDIVLGTSNHGIYGIDVSNVTVDGIKISNIPDNNSGMLMFGTTPGTISLDNLRIFNSSFYGGGNPPTVLTDISNGWLFVDAQHCFADNLYSQDIGAFAHEFKNATRYSVASNLIAYNAETAFGLGSQIQPDGPSYNIISSLISHQCNQAANSGYGAYNLFQGVISNVDSSPSNYSKHLFVAPGENSVLNGGISTGAVDTGSVRFQGTTNHATFADFSSNSKYVLFDTNSAGNTAFIQNASSGVSIFSGDRFTDRSPNSAKSANANVIYSLRTGEWRGSSTGRYTFNLSDVDLSAAPILSSDRFVLESDQNNFIAIITDEDEQSGLRHYTPTKLVSEFRSVATGSVATDYVASLVNGIGTRLYTTQFRPNTDAALSLGAASFRWTVVYATTGSINTSDENAKQQIRSLSDAEKAVGLELKSAVKAFKFNSAVAAKGDGARIHVGVIAQEVEQIFIKHGLDADAYGVFCRDEVVDEVTGETKTVYGVRYDELFAFIISAL